MTRLTGRANQIKAGNKILNLERPAVMGILNVTPDSFSDGGKFNSLKKALQQIERMVFEGAAIIDIGGESTRPGSDPVSEEVELKRVIPVIKEGIKQFPEVLFSIDTTKYGIAEKALNMGTHIINDVSGLSKEPRLAELCGIFNAAYVLMHSQGDPKTMQQNPVYEDVIKEIELFFKKKISILRRAGVEQIIVDPGFGFGKTLEHNIRIVQKLKRFTGLGYPILAGVSRKSMIGQILNGRQTDGRLAGTVAMHYQCLINGAKILRVHDVAEAVDSVKVFEALHKN